MELNRKGGREGETHHDRQGERLGEKEGERDEKTKGNLILERGNSVRVGKLSEKNKVEHEK